jgi:hypothetical protein
MDGGRSFEDYSDMELTVRTLAEEPGLRARINDYHAQAWPNFVHEGNGTGGLWSRIYTDFAEFQFGLWDETGALVAVGDSIPLICDGTRGDLPPNIPEVLERGVAVKEDGRRPTALSALAAIARHHGLKTLVAPVRPTLKQHYPLTPMEKYVKWTRAGGACFDPWLQVHQRMGAEIMQVAPKAMVITDTVAKWQEWTGLRFLESGPYVVPGAFQPVTIDVRRNIGRYEEANVWMRHPAVRAERLGSEARAE